MSRPDSKHAFISHVHEDKKRVDNLCAILEAAGIPYWRDRNDLGPGDAWKAKIREAIRDGSLVFLACFSNSSIAKESSYMNEELTLAIEEIRRMPPGRVWLMPVRLDDVQIPEWEIGAGRTIRDLNYLDLFGKGQAVEAAKLVTAIHRLMGDKTMSTASALAAVEQASAADRTDTMKRLTKEMLLDPTRRIELDDLIGQEVQRIMAALNDASTFASVAAGTNDEQLVMIAERAREYWSLTEPFCASLQVAARWASSDSLSPWANGLRSVATAAHRGESGNTALLNLRYLPSAFGVFTAGLACVASNNWANLKALVVDPTIRDDYSGKPVILADATDMYRPFGQLEVVPNTLARAAEPEKDLMETLQEISQHRQQKYYVPGAEWLYRIIRPIFIDQLPGQETYDAEFDRTEVMLGLLGQDQALTQVSREAGWRGSRPNSYWFGRATWRASHRYGNPVEAFEQERVAQAGSWGPLKAGLFGGVELRADAALDAYGKDFADVASRRW